MSWWQRRGETVILRLHVQPRASKPGVAGPHGERLKLRLRASPSEGAANAELIAFLAREFGVPKSRVECLSGETSRDKTVAVHRPTTLPAWLAE